MSIPQIIHQSWKTSEIPENIYPREWQQSWKTLHPAWEYRLWTDEDNRELVNVKYPKFLSFFDGLDAGIKRADFSRFLYMHAFGGIYADLDFIAFREITPLLYGASIVVGQLSDDNPHYRIPNAFIASAPGLDFWIQIAEDAMNAPLHEQQVECLSGPFRLQWALDKYKPHGLRILDQHLIYPLDWIHFTNWEGGRYYREIEVDIAKRLRSMNHLQMAEAFAQSFAVTTWNHNW